MSLERLSAAAVYWLPHGSMKYAGRPAVAELQRAARINCDPYAEVRRVARQYVPTGCAWLDGCARPRSGVRYPCIGYVDADGRRRVAHQDRCPHT